MRIIDITTAEQLDELQSKLSREENVGIVDIYGEMVQYYFALEYNNEIIGIAAISPFGSESAEICKFYIEPKQRGKGLGVYLLKEAIKRLSKKGFKEAVIETTPESSLFWEKAILSYSTTQYDYNKFGITIGD